VIEKYLKHIEKKGLSPRSVHTEKRAICRLADWAGDNCAKDILDLTSDDVKEYFRMELKRTSKRTAYNRLIFVKKFYEFCLWEEKILWNPTTDILIEFKSKDRLPPTVPSEKQVKKFLGAIDENTHKGIRDRAMMELIYSSGIRRRELVNIKMKDINLKDRECYIREGKGQKSRTVVFGTVARDKLQKYLKVTRPVYQREATEYVFLSYRGTGLSAEHISKLFLTYCDEIPIHVTAHALRHACADHMLRNDAKITDIQKLLGHSRLSTTKKYTRVYVKDLHRMHKRFHPREKMVQHIRECDGKIDED